MESSFACNTSRDPHVEDTVAGLRPAEIIITNAAKVRYVNDDIQSGGECGIRDMPY